MARGVQISATTPEWDGIIRTLRALPKDVQADVRVRGKTLAEPLAREIRSAGTGQGSHAAAVARTVKTGIVGGKPTVSAGGLPYTMGSEFGGRGSRKRPIIRGRPLFGKPVTRPIFRRTTMQFRPHRGKEGYWFFSTVREGKGLTAVMKAWRDLVDDAFGKWAA